MADTHSLPEAVLDVLCCPATRDRLRRQESALVGVQTGARYPVENGRPDLHLAKPLARTSHFLVGEDVPDVSAVIFGPLPMRAAAEVSFDGLPIPSHMGPEIMSWIPAARGAPAVALDVGCGNTPHRPLLERAGFVYAGLDYRHAGAPILGDAHALPFVDNAVEFVLSVAVLEHLMNPFLAIEEIARVLKPGGSVLGTVSFLEPWHDRSFFHHSHLAVLHLLRHARLEAQMIAPSPGWSGLHALSTMALFPRMPAPMVRMVELPMATLHRMWWRLGRLIEPKGTEELRVISTPGSLTFLARKGAG